MNSQTDKEMRRVLIALAFESGTPVLDGQLRIKEVPSYAALVANLKMSADRIRDVLTKLEYSGELFIEQRRRRTVRAIDSPFRRISERRKRIHSRDNHSCLFCGYRDESNKTLTLDHLIPRSLGGKNRSGNLATACGPCNSAKSSKLPANFIFEKENGK